MPLLMEQRTSAVNQQEIGWLCGLIDTDGGTELTVDPRWNTVKPGMAIKNTNTCILAKVIELYRALGVSYYVGETKGTLTNRKQLNISVSGFKRVSRLPKEITPILKQWELDVVRKVAERKLALGKSANDEYVEMLIGEYKKYKFTNRRDPQRLNVMLSGKNDQFLSGWLAGVIDGDGAIMLTNNSIGHSGKMSIRAVVVIVAEEIAFAETVLSAVERLGSTGYVQKKGNGSGTIYHVVIANRSRVYPLLSAITPYLVGKQKQAEIAMEFCDLRSSSGYNAPYTKKEYELQRSVKALNARGNSEMMI